MSLLWLYDIPTSPLLPVLNLCRGLSGGPGGALVRIHDESGKGVAERYSSHQPFPGCSATTFVEAVQSQRNEGNDINWGQSNSFQSADQAEALVQSIPRCLVVVI